MFIVSIHHALKPEFSTVVRCLVLVLLFKMEYHLQQTVNVERFVLRDIVLKNLSENTFWKIQTDEIYKKHQLLVCFFCLSLLYDAHTIPAFMTTNKVILGM